MPITNIFKSTTNFGVGWDSTGVTISGDSGTIKTSSTVTVYGNLINYNSTSIFRKSAGSQEMRLENTGNGNYCGIRFVRERLSGPDIGGAAIRVMSDTASNNCTLTLGCNTGITSISGALTGYIDISNTGVTVVGSTGLTVTGGLSNNGVSGATRGITTIYHGATGSVLPGCLSLYDKNGTRYYLWVSSFGKLMISVAAPTGNETPTGYTVVGTQT